MEKCEWCSHSLDDNSHGVDQSDFSGTVYLGACKYCNQCYIRPTKRAVDEGDSAPFQAESTPEHLPIEEAESNPALRN